MSHTAVTYNNVLPHLNIKLRARLWEKSVRKV